MDLHGDAAPETGVVLPAGPDVSADETVEFAVAAERAGADSLWCAEGWGQSPVALLGRVSERTDCVLGTGIANVFARTPGALASHALTLHQATDGRFVLGIGASTPSIVEGFHGVDYERPLRRVRETLDVLHAAFAGEDVEYDGEFFAPSGYALAGAEGGVDVPVVNAALGPSNLALSVDRAEGVVTHLLPVDRIPDALAAARERVGRDADVHVSAQLPACVADDHDEARETMARHLAFYVGAAEAYHDVVARHGFADEADAVRVAWQDGDYAGAREHVTEALLDAVGVYGTPERARRRLDEVLSGRVDTAVLTFPDGADAETRRETLAVFDR